MGRVGIWTFEPTDRGKSVRTPKSRQPTCRIWIFDFVSRWYAAKNYTNISVLPWSYCLFRMPRKLSNLLQVSLNLDVHQKYNLMNNLLHMILWLKVISLILYLPNWPCQQLHHHCGAWQVFHTVWLMFENVVGSEYKSSWSVEYLTHFADYSYHDGHINHYWHTFH